MSKPFTLQDLKNSACAKLNGHVFEEYSNTKRKVSKKGEIVSNKAVIVPENEENFPVPGVINVAMAIMPLSVNGAWKGQRFKTDEYKDYEERVINALPDLAIPAPPYRVRYEFGLSNNQADFDNPVKPLTDILQKKYQFNDKKILEATIKKVIVAKGEEYFTVTIETII